MGKSVSGFISDPCNPDCLKSRKGMLTCSSGSLNKEIIEFLALPPSSCSVMPSVSTPSPTHRSPYAALFTLRTSRPGGGGSNALCSCSLFFPAEQLAAWVTGTNSPNCEGCSPASAAVSPKCPAVSPSSGQPDGVLWSLQPEVLSLQGFLP